jgi:hypothetical protein
MEKRETISPSKKLTGRGRAFCFDAEAGADVEEIDDCSRVTVAVSGGD